MLLVVLGLCKAFFIVGKGYIVTICNSKMKHLVRRRGRTAVLQLPLEALLLRGGAGVEVWGCQVSVLRRAGYACPVTRATTSTRTRRATAAIACVSLRAFGLQERRLKWVCHFKAHVYYRKWLLGNRFLS